VADIGIRRMAAVEWIRKQWDDRRMRFLVFAAALLAVSLPLNYLMLRLTGWSAWWPTYRWLLGNAGESGDSWHVMAIALDWIRNNPDGGLYEAIFFEGQNKFQYAPTSLLPLAAFEALGIEPTVGFLNGVNRLFILVTAAAVSGLVHVLLGRTEFRMSPLQRVLAAGMSGAAVLVFYPVMMAYNLGQLQVWINMLFVLACLAWAMDRRASAGVAIGLICLLKPQFGLFLIWGLLRKEWRFVFPLCIVGAGGLLISIGLFGFMNHLEYISVLQFLSRHGESYWANQSMNGLLHRLAGNGVSDWEAGGFPPYSLIVYAGSMIATVAILVLALRVRRGEGAMASLFDFMLAALAFTAASPIAWEHHYGVMAPMFAALFVMALTNWRQNPSQRPLLIAFVVCYLFAANSFGFTRALDGAPLNIAQSYLYFSALGVLVLLRRLASDPSASQISKP